MKSFKVQESIELVGSELIKDVKSAKLPNLNYVDLMISLSFDRDLCMVLTKDFLKKNCIAM